MSIKVSKISDNKLQIHLILKMKFLECKLIFFLCGHLYKPALPHSLDIAPNVTVTPSTLAASAGRFAGLALQVSRPRESR